VTRRRSASPSRAFVPSSCFTLAAARWVSVIIERSLSSLGQLHELRVEPGDHGGFVAPQILKRDGAQRSLERSFYPAPQDTNRAVRNVHTLPTLTRVAVAKFLREELPSQHLNGLQDPNLVRGSGEAIAASCAAGADDEPPSAQPGHDPCRILGAESLGRGDLLGGDRLSGLPKGDLEKAAQAVLLEAIPEEKRRIFLVLGRMGLRPNETIALEVADYQKGWLHVTKAVKGRRLTDPIRAPKNNRGKRLPVDPELEQWIEKWVPRKQRLVRAPLFQNPTAYNEAKRWTPSSLRRVWERACREIGLAPMISLYEGTKHTFATAAKERGIEDRLLQRYLGHRDRRSVERYARLADTALIAVLRRREAPSSKDDLSPACRQAKDEPGKSLKSKGEMVEAAGIEPASEQHPVNASTCVDPGLSRPAPPPDPGSAGPAPVILASGS